MLLNNVLVPHIPTCAAQGCRLLCTSRQPCRQLSYGAKYSDDPYFNKPVVVMADYPKNDMDEEIAGRLKAARLDLYTRSGDAQSLCRWYYIMFPRRALCRMLETCHQTQHT